MDTLPTELQRRDKINYFVQLLSAKGFDLLAPVLVGERLELGHRRLPVPVVAASRVEEVDVGRPPLKLLHQVVQGIRSKAMLALEL